MSSHDLDDVGTMGSSDPAVRDPERSIRRSSPPRPPHPIEPTYGYAGGPLRFPTLRDTARNVALGAAAIALGVALVVLVGFAAHAIWYAIHLGWQLANG